MKRLVENYRDRASAMKPIARLRAALAALTSFTRIVAENDAPTMALVWALLRDVSEDLPHVTCWCIVADYRVAEWRAVRDGFTTKSQADACRDAIEVSYEAKYPNVHSDRIDRFTVERRECRVTDIIDPSVTAEQYAELL